VDSEASTDNPRFVVWVAVPVLAAVLFCVVVLAALGKGILANLAIEWALCLVVISLVGMVIGTIAGGAYVEVMHKEWTHFTWVHKLYIFSSGGLLLAGNGFFFWWLFSSGAPWGWRLAISAGSVAGIALGAWLALFPVPPLPPALARGPLAAFGPPADGQPRRTLWSHDRDDLADDDHWTPSTPLWLLLGAAIGVVVAVGYIGVSAWHENAYVPSFGETPPVPAGISGGYLVLGDSYSAGEGLSPFESPTDRNGCHRSAAGLPDGYPDTTNAAYGVLLHQLLGARVTSFGFVACSSAIVHDVLNERGDGIVKPQVDLAAKMKSPVGLVTLTIGGNDAIFSTVVRQCLIDADCLTADFPPGGTSAEQTDGQDVPVGPLGTEWAPRTIVKIGEEDFTLFSKLRGYFGKDTRIIVLGYPHLFPEDRTIGFPWMPQLCAAELSRFGPAKQQALWQLQIDLTDRTYVEAAAAGVEFVSPDAIWGQHMPCGTDTPYTHSFKPYLGIPPIDSGAFHPNAAGQHAYFDLLACYLDANPTAPSAFLPGAPVLTSIPVDTPLGDNGLAQLHLAPVPGEAQVPGHGKVNGC
jgi:hypothetical protein